MWSARREFLAQLHGAYRNDNWNACCCNSASTRPPATAPTLRQLLDRLLRRHADGENVSPYVIGEGYKAVGDYDQAMDWFTRAVEQHHPHALMNMPLRNRNHPSSARIRGSWRS